MSRAEAALAEIARREADERTYGSGANDWTPDVLRGDREVLERHTPERFDSYEGAVRCRADGFYTWPCPDAARVLDRYAPETTP